MFRNTVPQPLKSPFYFLTPNCSFFRWFLLKGVFPKLYFPSPLFVPCLGLGNLFLLLLDSLFDNVIVYISIYISSLDSEILKSKGPVVFDFIASYPSTVSPQNSSSIAVLMIWWVDEWINKMRGFTSTTGKMFEVPPTKNPLWGPIGLVCKPSAHFL